MHLTHPNMGQSHQNTRVYNIRPILRDAEKTNLDFPLQEHLSLNSKSMSF